MPTLLQINVTSNWGSTGKIMEQIGLMAKIHGWDSYVAYGRHANPSQLKNIKIGNKLATYEHWFENFFFDREGLASRYATRQFLKKVDIIKPDIVHLHNIHDHFLNYELLFEHLNKNEIPVVWTFHDCWAFTGHCCHFVQKNCRKWQTECTNCVMRNRFLDCSHKNFLLKKFFFVTCKNLTIVPCSNWMGDFVKKSFFKEKCIQVIHNGIDLSTFKVLSNKKQCNDTFQIIAVSNVWKQYKGIFDIFELREMLSEYFKITIVGLTEEQIRSLPAGIQGISRTQNVQELVQLYNDADVLINPTYADTFPTVNLEALACGTPVITYKTGGSPEAIDENTGIVVPQGDVKALSEAIIKLKENPLSSEACRKRAEMYFDKDKCFHEYIELYNEILKKY